MDRQMDGCGGGQIEREDNERGGGEANDKANE